MATTRWGVLKPARVASLGAGNTSVFSNTPCRVTTRTMMTVLAPKMSASQRSDWCARRELTAPESRSSELG